MPLTTEPMRAAIARIGRSKKLDAFAERATSSVHAATQPAWIKNLLSGSWLGPQLHPILKDVPIGLWSAATALDLTAGDEGAVGAIRNTAGQTPATPDPARSVRG